VEGINQIKAGMGTFRISSGVKTSFPYGSFITISNKPTLAVGSVVNPPIVGQADLAIISLVSYPNPGGGYLVEAIVQNQGDLDTQNGFYTDLYVDHLPTGSGDYTGSLQFWVNDPIAAGATVTLTTVLTELPGLGAHALSPASETTGTLYAQVDSTGAVGELDNDNNIYAAGTEICVATADAYESDDTAATASTIGVGETQTHNFDGPGDRDWAKFRAEAGQSYLLTTADLGASSDTYLYLYDTDGVTLLASNDDYGGTLASQIEWIAPTTGTYYVLVQHWNPNAGGCGTRYNLAIGEPSLYLYLPLVQR